MWCLARHQGGTHPCRWVAAAAFCVLAYMWLPVHDQGGRGGHSDDEEGMQISSLDGTNGLVIHGRDDYDGTGWSVSSGDVNGDGYSDLLFGAFASRGLSNLYSQWGTGETYVVFGKASGWNASMSVGSGCCFLCAVWMWLSFCVNVHDHGGCVGHTVMIRRACRYRHSTAPTALSSTAATRVIIQAALCRAETSTATGTRTFSSAHALQIARRTRLSKQERRMWCLARRRGGRHPCRWV